MAATTAGTASATTTALVPAPVDAGGGHGGRTVVAPKAVVAIARQAASEVSGVELVAEPGLRRLLAELLPGGAGAQGASATLASGTAALEIHLAVGWPHPVVTVAEQVRGHVRSRVEDLTGFRVSDVDIVVDTLPLPGRGRAGRVE
jgi:uncharacterized alkaline shock family protein YloU